MTEFGEIDAFTCQMIQSFRNEALNSRYQAQKCPTCQEEIKSRFIHHTKLCRQFSPYIKKIGEQRYQCILCRRSYGKREDLYRHCRIKHPDPELYPESNSEAADIVVGTSSNLPHFFQPFVELKNQTLHCKLCNFAHLQEESMSLHLQKCHAESSRVWNMNLVTEANLKIGQKMEEFLRNFSHRCPTCNEIISSGKMTHLKVCLRLSPFIQITEIRRYQCKICAVERGLRKDAFRHLQQKHKAEIDDCYAALKANESVKVFQLESPVPQAPSIKQEETPDDSEESGSFTCNLCDRKFGSISSIQLHLEMSHAVPKIK